MSFILQPMAGYYLPLTGGTLTGALTIASGTLTASAPALSITQTWTTGATFTARVMNITDTSSNSASLFEDYQIAGVSKVSIRKDGYISSTGLISSGEVYISVAGTLNFNGSSFVFREASGVLGQIGGATAQAYHIYGTADGYPGANYQRLVLSANGTTGVTIAAEGLGTPGANQNITLTPGGTGRLTTPAIFETTSGIVAGFLTGGATTINYYTGGVRTASPGEFAWTAGNANASVDAALMRNAAGIVEVNNGTAGTFRDLKLRNLINNPSTFAGLTAAATAGAGARAFINDGAANVYGVAAAGGGALKIPVYSDGANWIVG